MDRAKPGMITVNAKGERFLNESTSYHLFGLAMQQAHQRSPSIPAFLIADAAALKRYGITLDQVVQAVGANGANTGGALLVRGDEALAVRSIRVRARADAGSASRKPLTAAIDMA